ncbi:MAG: 50S ribosomal protein L31e [Nanoarchaeota archaeon]
MAKEEPKIDKVEREFIIPLRREWEKVPKYQRANRTIKTIKQFLVRHMKVYDRDLNKIRIDKFLNEFIWARGIKKPPIKVKVKAFREGEIIRVELSELPKKLKFKKAKLEKRSQKATEVGTKKKAEKIEEVQKPEEKTEEEIKEEKEKKAAVVQAGKEMEKNIAKTEKHQTKLSKQPKHQRRMALQK